MRLATINKMVFVNMILFTVITSVHSQVYTNIGEISQIVPFGNYLWCATKGGVAKWNTKTMEYEVFTVEHGLGVNASRDIAIAPDSTLWVTTWGGGVSHFDGLKWMTYSKENGLKDDLCSKIRISRDGTVWVGTFRGGISRFRDGEWITYTVDDGLPSDTNAALGIAPDGTVWAAQSVNTSGSLCWFDGNRWNRYEPEECFPNYGVNFIEFDPYGNMWLSINSYVPTLTALLVKMKNGEIQHIYSKDDGMLPYEAADIAFSPDGRIWTAMHEGLHCFDGTQWLTYKPDTIFTTVAVDDYGILWAGSRSHNNGLTRYDGNRWDVFRAEYNIASNDIYSLAIDTIGIIWAGTIDGISRFNGTNWLTYTTENGLSSNFVVVVAADPTGGIWAAMSLPKDCALAYFNGIMWTQVQSDLLTGWNIEGLEFDRKGKLWIGATRRSVQGVNKFDGIVVSFDGDTWESYTIDTGTAYNGVLCLSVGPDGDVWAGTMKGVFQYNGTEWIYHNSQSDFLNHDIYAIKAASDSTVYIGAGWDGIYRFNNNSWEIFLNDDSDDIYPINYYSNSVRDIEELPDGSLWFACQDGVFYYDGKSFGMCTSANGEPLIEATSIAHKENMVFIGTQAGLYCCGGNPAFFKTAVTQDIISGGVQNNPFPEETILLTVNPNPFNPETGISCMIPRSGHVTLHIYNSAGQLVSTLVDDVLTAGNHTFHWNGTSDSGLDVSTGLYFANIRQDNRSVVTKMMLIR